MNDLILQPLASSLAVLTEDEKELGVVLVDIGGGIDRHRHLQRGRDPSYGGDPYCR